ncbi:drug/metabolite transporter superfamily protein YnfA [Bacillus atrophaeus]|nr:drug/metabolite transporter superfamily protein YnfA [Bacillus atrophaeus]
MLLSILLFLAAGVAEIGGGYLIWLWLRETKPVGYGIAGALILIVYGVLSDVSDVPFIWPYICRLRRRIYRAGRAVGLAY